jgi:hypothetical protein
LLFSYNFLPKSWVYVALNDVRGRSPGIDLLGLPVERVLKVSDRAAVLKVKYLYYF